MRSSNSTFRPWHSEQPAISRPLGNFVGHEFWPFEACRVFYDPPRRYRMYPLCERLGKAEDARAYNERITSWTGIESAAASAPTPSKEDLTGFEK